MIAHRRVHEAYRRALRVKHPLTSQLRNAVEMCYDTEFLPAWAIDAVKEIEVNVRDNRGECLLG